MAKLVVIWINPNQFHTINKFFSGQNSETHSNVINDSNNKPLTAASRESNNTRIKASGVENANQTRILSVGDSTTINTVNITVNSVVNDGRCPTNINCVLADNVVVNIDLQRNGQQLKADIELDETIEFSDRKIALTNINPQAINRVQINQSDYRLTFRVSN